jgi:hypothetical protein
MTSRRWDVQREQWEFVHRTSNFPPNAVLGLLGKVERSEEGVKSKNGEVSSWNNKVR